MNNTAAYEAPEIFELGDASKITLGQVGKPLPDSCDCSKDKTDEDALS